MEKSLLMSKRGGLSHRRFSRGDRASKDDQQKSQQRKNFAQDNKGC